MSPETYKTTVSGHQITLVLDDATANDIIRVAGHQPLRIPQGCNTVTMLLRDASGNAAMAYRQSGFKPLASDDEQEINGTGIIILDNSADMPDEAASAALETIKTELLK